MVALALAMALSGLFFLSLILFPMQAHWMLFYNLHDRKKITLPYRKKKINFFL